MDCTLRPLRANELPIYEALGRTIFPEADWESGIHRVKRMMALWPDGIWSVWENSSLQACMTLWPISELSASALESGTIDDEFIDANLFPEDLNAHIQSWIITAAWVLPAEPSIHRQAFQLLARRLTRHLGELAPVRVYAHALTEAGRKICLAMGFRFSFPMVPLLCVTTRESLAPENT
jgi:hypothetical protein